MKQWGRWLAAIAAGALVAVTSPDGAIANSTLPATVPTVMTAAVPITGDGDPSAILTSAGAPSGTGTLKVSLYKGNPHDDVKPPKVVGVKIQVQKVKDVSLADSTSWNSIKNLTPEQAATKELEPVASVTTDNNGTVKFTNLAVGLYLVKQLDTTVPSFHPFLVTLPVADKAKRTWNYQLEIQPKPNIPKPPDTGQTGGSGDGGSGGGINGGSTNQDKPIVIFTEIPTPSPATPTPSTIPTQSPAIQSSGPNFNPGNDDISHAEPSDTPKSAKKDKPPIGGAWMRAPNGDMVLVGPDGEILARLPATGVVAMQIGGAALLCLALGMVILMWVRRRAQREHDASQA